MPEPFSPAGQPRKAAAEAYPATSGPKPAPTHQNGDKSALTPRIEATQRERRRRVAGAAAGLRLYVPEEMKDPAFEYRWINANEQRMHAKTKLDDWDPVTIPGLDSTRLAGEAKDGSGLNAILCRKPKELFQEDKARELQAIKDKEDAMKRGSLPVDGGLKGETSYIPDRTDGFSSDKPGQNRIGN